MKLFNKTLKYFSFALLLIVAVWSVVFYFSMLNQIKDSLDEELEHQKRLIIQNVLQDSVITEKTEFDESLYTISKIDKETALLAIDKYSDTKLLMQDADDPVPEPEPVRMLTTVFKANGNYYELTIANPIIEENDLIKALTYNVIGLYLILIISIIVINNIILKRMWQPFYAFIEKLKKYKIDSSEPLKLNKTNIKEFDDLQQSVSDMNKRSLETFKQQKEFIENASHELQTPIAIASNKLELLFESETLQDNDAQKITETYQILQRLSKLNKSLLLLLKIENRQISDLALVDINSLIIQCIEELEDFASYKNINIELHSKANIKYEMNQIHAYTLIANLLKNAIFHNTSNGSVDIYIEEDSLSICNSASGNALNKNKIFNRFVKSDSSTKGTGLGLAITKAICNLYDFTLSYSFTENKHCFKVFFEKG